MSQHDLDIANQGFPNFRADLNNALQALGSVSAGATEPSTIYAYQLWLDTSTTPSTLKQRNGDNDAWVSLFYIDQSTDLMSLPDIAGNLTLSNGNLSLTSGDITVSSGDLTANAGTNYLGQTHIGDSSNTGTLANQLTISDTNSTASVRLRFGNSEGGFDLGTDNGNINFYGNLASGNPVLLQIDDSTGDVNVNSGDITVSDRFETKEITVADDSYAIVTPPRNGGFCIFTFGGDTTTPGNTSSALFFYDVGSSLSGTIQTSVSTNVTIANADRTGTSGADGSMNIGIRSGVIHFENRVGLTKNIQITFV